MFAGLIASAVSFFMVYRIIKPLIGGEKPSAGYYAVHIAVIIVCWLALVILKAGNTPLTLLPIPYSPHNNSDTKNDVLTLEYFRLVVTHDTELILACCDEIIRLKNGNAAEI